MERVLSRSVIVEGVPYTEGTSLDKLPEGNRESLIGTGWTRFKSAETEVLEQPVTDPDAGSQPVESDPVPADESTADSPTVDEVIDDSPAITTIGLADDVTELLVGAGVTTVNQAKQYRDLNGSFRTIKGITKVRDGLINTLLDQ